MPRQRRPEIDGGTFHVFARGNRKQDIFESDSDRHQFLIHLALVAERYRWDVLAYCLMRNHFHLIVRTPDGGRSAGMQSLNAGYARYFNDTYGLVGHLFQRPYGLTVAPSDGDAMYLACYVLLNPVRAGICERREEYGWSTLGAARAPGTLGKNHLTALFGSAERLVTVLEAAQILRMAGFERAVAAQNPSRYTSL